MIHIINDLAKVLNLIKGLNVAHGAPKNGIMLLEREGDGVYKIEITKIGEKNSSIQDFDYLL